jgi:hypothetical protein
VHDPLDGFLLCFRLVSGHRLTRSIKSCVEIVVR